MAEITLSRFPITGHLKESKLIPISPEVIAGWRAKRTSEDVRRISEEFTIPVHRINRVFHEGRGNDEVISALTNYFNNKP